MRNKAIEYQQRWDVVRAQMAEVRRIEEIRNEKMLLKRSWITILTSKMLIEGQFLGKFKQLKHMKKIAASISRMTNKLIAFIRLKLRKRGKTTQIRLVNQIKQSFTFLN